MTCSSYFGMSAFAGVVFGILVAGLLVWIFAVHVDRILNPPEEA